jgi:hypothetical protein
MKEQSNGAASPHTVFGSSLEDPSIPVHAFIMLICCTCIAFLAVVALVMHVPFWYFFHITIS